MAPRRPVFGPLKSPGRPRFELRKQTLPRKLVMHDDRLEKQGYRLGRRDFQRVVLGAAAAGLTSSFACQPEQAAASEPADDATLANVDTHQHLWDLSKFTL